METTVKEIEILLKYNNHDVTKDFSKYLQSVTYTDYEEEQSDELTLELKDNDKKFQNNWWLDKGSKLSFKAGLKGTKTQVNFGTFTTDEPEMTFSTSGDNLSVKALAATSNSPVRTTNTRYFNNKTLVQIAKYFGNIYGFKVVGEQGNVNVGRVNQVNESDLAFLRRISKIYGYVFKLTDGLLTFTKIDTLTNSDVLFTLNKEDISELRLTDSNTKVYKSCRVQYFNPKTKKLVSYTASRNSGTDTLKLNLKCRSKDEAKRVAEANLKSGSKEIKGSITLKDINTLFFAGVNFSIKGFGRFDGKYHIKSATHNISDGNWQVSGEIEKCL